MQRPTPIELGILILSAFFLVVGLVVLVHPTATFVYHQSYRYRGGGVEHVSKTGAQGYGLFCIGIGSALGWAVVSKRNRRP
jgi:hypothetical protein